MTTNDLHDLQRQHSEAMDRLHDAIAISRGVRSFSSMKDGEKYAVVGFAVKLCKAWEDNPGLRENGTGDSFVMFRVSEQFSLAEAIAAANDVGVSAGNVDRPSSRRKR